MARLLLILPTATYRATDFLDAAAEVGAEVVVASERRQVLAETMKDRFLQIDLRRPEAAAASIVAASRTRRIDGIVAVDDQGVLAAALAAGQLDLPHNPPTAVMATRNKLAMRDTLAEAGVPQPRYTSVGPNDDVGDAAATVGFPCVIKPTSLSASRGVIRADDPPGAKLAGDRVRAIAAAAGEDPAGPLLVEAYVAGAEVAVEGLLRDGVLETLAVFDKPDPLEGPYFEETIYVTPSRLPAAATAAVERTAAAACAAMGLVEGPVHVELRTDGTATWLIEVAARSIGGLCSRSLSFGVGLSLERLIVAHALREPLEGLARERRAAGVMMLPIPARGRLETVTGQNEARQVQGITELDISIAPGRLVRPLPEGDRYLGFLFAKGDTPEEVEASLRRAHAHLDVRVVEDDQDDD
ncbi:MAG TPA: ATP-grasp domain-containing protein [Acidimicrobiales bacterium]